MTEQEVEEDPAAYLESTYGTDTSSWLNALADGSYEITDLAEFINGTGLVRNKDIPGFDTLDLSAEQTYLVNATQIMLDVAAGTQEADIAQYWRTRNGTADQHTSFSAAYNITLAAQMAGIESDYALVWAMGHGSNEGTTTGTFVDWINEICAVK